MKVGASLCPFPKLLERLYNTLDQRLLSRYRSIIGCHSNGMSVVADQLQIMSNVMFVSVLDIYDISLFPSKTFISLFIFAQLNN